MRTLWMFHRARLVAAVVVVVLVLAAAAVVVLAGDRQVATNPGSGPRSSVGRPTSSLPGHRAKKDAGTAAPARLAPTPRIAVPETPVQRQIDAELAQAETPASIAAAQATSVPTAAVSAAYPSIGAPERSDPSAYAIAFASELIDTTYTTQSRAALLAWAEHEEAPNTLPGVPASVAGKALVLSLADPDLPGGSASPTPTAAQWAADAGSGVIQSVSDVQAEVDPDWTQIISQGWQPRDPLMTIEVVTGTLTVVTKGQSAPPQSFSLTLTLGSAAHVHAGYGAVAAGNWTLG